MTRLMPDVCAETGPRTTGPVAGLDRLPGFVRRLPRVTRWAGCKLILYHARLLAQEAAEREAA